MAISFVDSAYGSGTTNADLTLTLPTCLEGDVVVVAVGMGNLNIASISTADYTSEAGLIGSDVEKVTLRVGWKRMGATPDTTVTLAGSYGKSAVVHVWRGVDVTAMDVTTTTATGIDSGIPNAPSITPITEGAVVIACGTGSVADAAVTGPAGYANHVTAVSSSTYSSTTSIASKAWSGSGAEDPPAWTDWTTQTWFAWCAATLALRPAEAAAPPEPSSGSLTLTGGEPTPGTAVPVSPLSGEIAITGGTPTPVVDTSVRPATVQMRLSGQTPAVQMVQRGSLAVNLPTLVPLFQALGNYATLNVSLPTLVFAGVTSSPSWLDVDLPTLVPAFAAGTALTVDLPFPEVAFSAVMGATCTLDVDLPTLVFSAGAGAVFALDLPEITPLFTSTTGSVASLNVTLPAFAALFTADVENLAQLVVHLPDLLPAFSSHQQTLGQLIVDLPPLSVLFSGSAGGAASLHITLPELQVLLTSYEEITGQMVVVLPALKALFSAAQSGRFDTTTALQLDGTVLRYRRPV